MTNDQKAAFNYLENAIRARRMKGRIEAIRRELLNYKATLKKIPWWKRFFGKQ